MVLTVPPLDGKGCQDIHSILAYRDLVSLSTEIWGLGEVAEWSKARVC